MTYYIKNLILENDIFNDKCRIAKRFKAIFLCMHLKGSKILQEAIIKKI